MPGAPADSPTACVNVRRTLSAICQLLLQVVRSHKAIVAKAAASAKKTDGRNTDKAGEGAPKHAKKAGSGEKKRKASREEQPAEHARPAKSAVSKSQKKQKRPVGAVQVDGSVSLSVHGICHHP